MSKTPVTPGYHSRTSARSFHLSRHHPLQRILLRNAPIIFPNLTRLIPQPLKLSVPILSHRPNALPQPLMSLPILLYPLLNLSLIQPLGRMRNRHHVGRGVLGVGRDGAERRVGVFGHVVAFGKAGFDLEDGIGK